MYSELRPIQTFEVDIWGRVVVIMVEAVLVRLRRRLAWSGRPNAVGRRLARSGRCSGSS